MRFILLLEVSTFYRNLRYYRNKWFCVHATKLFIFCTNKSTRFSNIYYHLFLYFCLSKTTMVVLPIITIFILLNSYTASSQQDIGLIFKLISDIIRNENVPSHLSAFTCWSNIQRFQFVKNFDHPVQISSQFEINPRVSDDFTNKLWYFIDMRCERSVQFLHQIEEDYFAHPYRWILYEPESKSSNNLTFLIDSNVILINSNAKQNHLVLKQSKNKNI